MARPPDLVDEIRSAASPLLGDPRDLDPLIKRIGDARFVLLGEASHGTHEFYDMRAAITRRLILEKGFTAIAVEADWPDAARVDRWIRGAHSRSGGVLHPEDVDATAALSAFRRFPSWMWRNTEVMELVRWLRHHNDAVAVHGSASQVGFYGLDLYGLHGPIDDVLAGSDGHLHAAQTARIERNAGEYRRSLQGGKVCSWNLRDRHMAETLDALAEHLETRGTPPRIVVWEHNSHLGDARATEMGQRGELNVGQLVRERYGNASVLVGFTTYHGWVMASSEWDAPPRPRPLQPALDGSYEALFHETGLSRFLLLTTGERAVPIGGLEEDRLERAIGVVYYPQTERLSHYFHARLSQQFDAVVHIDETSPTEPLPPWRDGAERHPISSSPPRDGGVAVARIRYAGDP